MEKEKRKKWWRVTKRKRRGKEGGGNGERFTKEKEKQSEVTKLKTT